MNREELLGILHEQKNIIITTHESPDGDALGSEVALYLALKSIDKNVYILNADPYESRYDFILDQIPIFNPEQWLKENQADLFILIILDTSPDNIGHSMDIIKKSVSRVIPIDHHDTINPDNRFPGYYQSDASSTCEMIYQFITLWDLEISLTMANALFTGIVYDTGSFKYKKTSSKTFSIASHLVEIGVNPFFIYTSIYESNTKASLLLLSKVMSSLNFYYNDQVSILIMPKELLEETQASFEEAQTLINIPLVCKSVELSLFFKEDKNGLKRCSLRSKGLFNCLHIAEDFGGGGHETAAGFKFFESIEYIKRKVLEDIRSFFT